MCGISGLIKTQKCSLDLKDLGNKMNENLRNRGPDDSGIFYDNQKGILINHTRLSINDLSTNGHQPMESNSRRYIISFNGEIYNFTNLKKEIENSSYEVYWKGHSDTEVLLAAIDHWGLKDSLKKIIGMFAIALYDKEEETITLARDRFGEKPLYWGYPETNNNCLIIFGSDLSVFKNFKTFDNKISREALSLFLNYSYIPSPYSIYEKIWKLEAGHLLTIKVPLNNQSNTFVSESWWDLTNIIKVDNNLQIKDEKEAIKIIEGNLKESVESQSKADVNVTSFLSGGIDSSLITAILQSTRAQKINTFTVGFENKNYNEAPFAKSIADYLGTEHNEIIFTYQDALELIPVLSKFYSEPFADPAAIPTLLMCKAAEDSGFKVALSGDGADELFGGYNRYTLAPRIWSIFSKLNPKLRPFITSLMSYLPSNFGSLISMPQFKERVDKLSYRLKYSNSLDELYQLLVKEWYDISILLKDYNHNLKYDIAINKDLSNYNLNPISKMMAIDCLSYLIDNNQVKIDRAAMAYGLETRSPFLDKNLVHSSWQICESLKVKETKGKYILKKILSNYMPEELFNRRKSGFATPIKEWLRGPLEIWGKDLINTKIKEDNSFICNDVVIDLWDDHINLKKDNSKKLWPILVWKAWATDNS
tara:strand:+ start:110 stop:2056 length:1947 start_codon:yes stop_codon:yes gene_type:complete